MPARQSLPARDRAFDYSNVGKVGRRTGVVLSPRKLDSHGMEEISGLFSSPRKASPGSKVAGVEREGDIEQTQTQTPNARTPGTASTSTVRRSTRGASYPLVRSASPKKSGIRGSARRSGAVDVLAPKDVMGDADDEVDEGEEEVQRENTQLTATPVQAMNPRAASARAATVRSFSPDRTPLRNRVLGRQAKSAYVARVSDVQLSFQEDTRIDDEADVPEETPSHVQTTHIAQDDALVAEQEDDQLDVLIEDQTDEVPDTVASDQEEVYLPAPPPVVDDEDEDETFEPPVKSNSQKDSQVKANSRRKRKSDAIEDDGEAAAVSSPAAKRAKRKSDQDLAASQKPVKQSASQKDKQKQPAKEKVSTGRLPLAKKDNNTKLSTQQQEELNGVVEKIRAKPGQKRSLYILKRETPADDDISRTRSGRISIKPLAYWRNEGIVWDNGDGKGQGLADGARFPLNSIKEITRHEQHPTPTRPRKKGKRKGKGKGHQEESSDLELDGDEAHVDPEADDWECDTGTLRAPISVWDKELQGPLDDEEEADIAHAAPAIDTKEVKGQGFKYAKLVSKAFFGTGLVDLPPGGVKKMKNSRRMHMSFFVFQGRVTVEVGPVNSEPTRFSIGKGGFWQVPRGNNYAIENEHGKTARIFFSQACEPVVE